MKKIATIIIFISLIFPITSKTQTVKPFESETEEKLDTFKLRCTLQQFNGFGKEKLAKNYTKNESYTGLKMQIGFGKEWIQIFAFASIEVNREKGVDYTPAGFPERWTEIQPIPEMGLGFKIEITFNHKEASGVNVEFESNMLEMIEDRYPVPTFSPSIFVKKKNLRFLAGNKFDITRDGQLQLFGALEYEF